MRWTVRHQGFGFMRDNQMALVHNGMLEKYDVAQVGLKITILMLSISSSSILHLQVPGLEDVPWWMSQS